MLLGVKLEPDPLDQIKLRLEEIDVVFPVHHQVLEQVAGDIILHGMTMRRRLLIQRTRAHLGCEVAINDFLDVWPIRNGSSTCMFGKPSRKITRSVMRSACCIFSIDAPDFGHVREAPSVQQPLMQPVLVDGSELVTQSLVKILDDFGVALHDELQRLEAGSSPFLSLERF